MYTYINTIMYIHPKNIAPLYESINIGPKSPPWGCLPNLVIFTPKANSLEFPYMEP